jgi:hypothetical protein
VPVERCLQLRIVAQNNHFSATYSLDFGRLQLQLRNATVVRGEVDRIAFCDARMRAAPQASVSAADSTTEVSSVSQDQGSSAYCFSLRPHDAVSLVVSFPLLAVQNEAAALELCERIVFPITRHAFLQHVSLVPLPQCSCSGHAGHSHTHAVELDATPVAEEEATAPPHRPHASKPTAGLWRSVPATKYAVPLAFIESDVVWTHYRYISGHFMVLEERDLVTGV